MKKMIFLLVAVMGFVFRGAAEEAAPFDLEAECEVQYGVLSRDLSNLAWFRSISNQTFRQEALVLATDRDPLDILLRRTGSLLDHHRNMTNSPALAAWSGHYRDLDRAARKVPVAKVVGRRALFGKVWRLQRQIALANPLLDFDRILFVKSKWSKASHCCDQYFGFESSPGGSVYVLDKVFSEKPELKDLLVRAKVKEGRLKGRILSGGSFRSPELSFNGQTVFFAHSECQPVDKTTFTPVRDCPPGRWNPGTSFHIFKLNVDAPETVEQLTDGPWNEFDPCLLPNGRLMFISERRGGFGRCHGRPVPTYTLHSMRQDGSDIVCLSFHDTNEWQPSVTHDGMVVYTRWDYVDRGDCIAHHPWITYPDGRDPRALHGNYPTRRGLRPDMELDVRAIPGSQRFVATAAPHHGQAYGSLVVFDPRIPDDGAMAPIRRLTPEVGFPETGDWRQNQSYGTAWPLDEEFYLCVYSPPGSGLAHGLYLIDSFGNRTLIYRDSELPCLGPIPLRARPLPPVIPHATAVGLPEGTVMPDSNAIPSEGTVGCINVYEAIKSWPTGTVITALRVIQLFPKPTVVANVPDIGIGSESLARGVLGTVPVEADGSARFIAPAGRMLYFQALDTNGCAVQSMMSATYVHPGETLTCVGCHENRHRVNRTSAQPPLAFQKPPSRPTPEPEGSYPVNYSRLVQPLLDLYCVGCHRKSPKAPDLSGTPAVWSKREYIGDKNTLWSQSYLSLIRGGRDHQDEVKKGFAYACGSRPPGRIPSETSPGEFGARASTLYELLKTGHHGVQLPPDALRRLTLWLDCNSVFYGAYHDLDRQRAGEKVVPLLN